MMRQLVDQCLHLRRNSGESIFEGRSLLRLPRFGKDIAAGEVAPIRRSDPFNTPFEAPPQFSRQRYAIPSVRRARYGTGRLGTRATYGRASKTILNGVSAALRIRVNPPSAMTDLSRVSPACAPRAKPTSCDFEAGVHRNVDAE